jgi:glycosyltransferase 2 family protein
LKNLITNILKKTIPLGLGVFLVWMSLKKLTGDDKEQIINSFKTANYWWVLVSLLIGIVSHFSRAYRWKFMLEPLGYSPKFLNSAMAVIITYLVNLGIPRAGELSRAAVLKKYEGVPLEKGFGTIVAERVADVAMLFIFIIVALFAQYELIKNLILSKLPKEPLVTVFIIIVLTLLGLVAFKWIKKSNNKFILKIKTIVLGLIEGVKSIFKMKKVGPFIFHTIVIWACYILMLYTATFALPETTGISWNAILISFVIGSFSYAATNGGIGAYPIAIQQSLLLYGISALDGLSFGWIMWTSQTIMVLIFGGLSFLFLPLYNKEKIATTK